MLAHLKQTMKSIFLDFDFNNLYGSVQTMNMPLNSFKCASPKLCKELKQYYFLKKRSIYYGR